MINSVESVLGFYGIQIVDNIPITGKDEYSIIQRNKAISKRPKGEVDAILAPLYFFELTLFGSLRSGVSARYTNDQLNEFYLAIKNLGCKGPQPTQKGRE